MKVYAEEEILNVKSNKVVTSCFEHPDGTDHDTHIPKGAFMPEPEVEAFEINQVDRKFFGGFGAIKLVERILGIDCGMVTTYKYGY